MDQQTPNGVSDEIAELTELPAATSLQTSATTETSNRVRFLRIWSPLHPPKLGVVLVHGLGDHSARLRPMAQWLCQRGAIVYALDLLGHGNSPGRRVCIPEYDALLLDLQGVLQLATQRYPDLPFGMFGQSMGGNLVINYLLRRRPHCDFGIAGSPMLRSVGAPGPWLQRVARLVMRVAPNLCIPAPVDTSRLAHDETVQQQFANDPLVSRSISLRLGAALIDSGQWALEQASSLGRPLLLMHGDEDAITDAEASQRFAAASPLHTTLKLWPGGRHDLHLDFDRVQYWQQLWDWTDHILTSPTQSTI